MRSEFSAFWSLALQISPQSLCFSTMLALGDYEHIIWDWNGTLLNDCELCVDVMNGILTRRSMPRLSIDDYRANFNFPVRDYYEWLGFHEDDTFEDVSHEFIDGMTLRKLEPPLHHGVAKLLRQLHDQLVDQVILSAHKQDTLEVIVQHYGISHYFDHIIGLDNIYAEGKTENGLAHFATLPHEPHEILLIGDTLHDAEVAKAMEVDCLLVAHGHQSEERLKQAGYPIIHSFDQIDIHGAQSITH
ncbi:HAD family hydrolase [Rubellicoccus peritrichatus]|uniref:phosphoglycolate phosphatase n=1 Tax=Rubellicoccus peritrichatus TaxID=3080537 RepID=A0AAQ3QWI7_9BACT|nr:HAD family hydrolase [Puniceicoccus sp. CR14]WOO41910.1 HAD family hydrolase [Puniceicoccus sp. CR14]